MEQQLTSIALIVRSLEHRLSNRHDKEAKTVSKILTLINQAADYVKNLAKELQSIDFDSSSLINALQDLATNTQHLFGIKCSFVCDEAIEIKNKEIATHLYRIVQEAVTNAVKHGRTRMINIKLTKNNNQLAITIENDGRDFPERQLNIGRDWVYRLWHTG